jgi:CRP-like cAMP-binding protein
VFMGVKKSGTRALVQGGGSAMRMRTATFLTLLNQTTSLRALLHRYTFALFTQISQSSACNRFHKTDERLARWLLMTSDRVGSDEFRLTQEFMAQMVGVRREAVNKSAGVFHTKKLIDYSRGAIAILNRAGLETVACSCYGTIRQSENFLAETVKHLHAKPISVRQRTVR